MTRQRYMKAFSSLVMSVLWLITSAFTAPSSPSPWQPPTRSRTPPMTALAKVIRIKFPKGATQTTVRGRLRGQNDVVHYVLRVLAGQRMQISVESTQLTNPQIDVIFPSGEHMDRDMQGTQYSVDSTQAGDYRIDVYEGRKGDPSNGTFALKIKVD